MGDSFSAASSDATAAAAAACGRDSGLRGSRRGLSGEVDDWEDEELLEQELQELGAVRPVLGQVCCSLGAQAWGLGVCFV